MVEESPNIHLGILPQKAPEIWKEFDPFIQIVGVFGGKNSRGMLEFLLEKKGV